MANFMESENLSKCKIKSLAKSSTKEHGLKAKSLKMVYTSIKIRPFIIKEDGFKMKNQVKVNSFFPMANL